MTDLEDHASGCAPPDAGTRNTPRDLTKVRRIALVVWLALVVLRLVLLGVSFDRTQILLLILPGLMVACIGRRRMITVVLDWLPFALLLVAYDLSRRVTSVIGLPVHWHLGPDVDRAMFGEVPTVWLQSHLKTATPSWWEVIISAIYISFFIVPYAIAAVLWLRDRVVWRKYIYRFIVMSFLALVGYVLVPAAPPWAAARCTPAEVADGPAAPACMFESPAGVPDGGLLGPVHPHNPGAQPYVERLSNRGWDTLHFGAASTMVDSNQASSNLVAAIPSLHAGLTAMVMAFLWPLVRRRWRPLLAAYALGMAFALVYTGEHYITDILIGWALAAAVLVGFRWFDRWRERRRARGEAERAGEPAESVPALNG